MTQTGNGQAKIDKEYAWPLVNGAQTEYEEEEIHAFVEALRRSKLELDIARQQFDNVNDPLLIDHVVFRLGAAERHFSYLLQLARQLQLNTGGMRWDWMDKD